jgi:integrase
MLVERTLRHMLAQNDQKTNGSISQTARLLSRIAAALNMPDEWQVQLRKMAQRVTIPHQTAMTAKNRGRLRVLQNDDNLLRLIDLPERMFARQKGKRKPFYEALEREDAIAIAILQHCPIRLKNLASIHLEHTLQRPGDGRAYLVFEGEDVKNDRPIEFEVPKEVLKLIDIHLSKRVPHRCPPGTPWLFPTRDGSSAIVESCLGTRISKQVLKETGLKVNAHLFRHLAVMISLDANPGAYESARRLLGHSHTSRTIQIYSGMETRSATKAFAELITSKKERWK